MKILWLVNIAIPEMAEMFNIIASNTGGWIVSQLCTLRQEGISVGLCYPYPKTKEMQTAKGNDTEYFLIPSSNMQFNLILEKFKPDIVHIFGTEYDHTLEMIKACGNIPYVVSIQGVMGECALHYSDGLPEKFNRIPLCIKIMSKIYYSGSIEMERQDFFHRAKLEEAAIQKARFAIGRTEFDKSYVKKINPSINYFHVNENLRDEFYSAKTWEYRNCEQYSIFVTQGFYPIKGFHMLLEKMSILIQKFPKLKIYIGGQLPYSLNNKLADKVVDYFFQYQKYIKELTKKHKLSDYIEYVGPQTAKQMVDMYLKCNMFLSTSSCENSPNSVAEAMMLGVPVVSSNVGGVPSMIEHDKEGLLYDFFSDNMTKCVIEVFDNPTKATELGQAARKKALKTHDRTFNTEQLIKAYQAITR